jgi:hypothetical protein
VKLKSLFHTCGKKILGDIWDNNQCKIRHSEEASNLYYLLNKKKKLKKYIASDNQAFIIQKQTFLCGKVI